MYSFIFVKNLLVEALPQANLIEFHFCVELLVDNLYMYGGQNPTSGMVGAVKCPSQIKKLQVSVLDPLLFSLYTSSL